MHHFVEYLSKMATSLHLNNAKPENSLWDGDLALKRSRQSRRRCLCLLIISLAAAFTVLPIFLWLLQNMPWQQNGLSHPKFQIPTTNLRPGKISTKQCGKTPSEGTASEAKALGCVYDIISGSWVFPECHDRELEDEFLAVQPPWHWWSDKEKEQEISVEEIRATGGLNPTGYFVTPEYHDHHCAFTWRKFHRAIQGTKMIDEHIGGMRHTNHCSSTMYRDRSEEPDVAHFDLIFSGCVEL